LGSQSQVLINKFFLNYIKTPKEFNVNRWNVWMNLMLIYCGMKVVDNHGGIWKNRILDWKLLTWKKFIQEHKWLVVTGFWFNKLNQFIKNRIWKLTLSIFIKLCLFHNMNLQ